MAETTRAGDELAAKLPDIGTTTAIRETCALIHRHAVTYSRIQEAWCNDEMPNGATARLEARETQLERRITALVDSLPESDDGPFSVMFEGDPRGYTVKIVHPAGRQHDDWGQKSRYRIPR